MSIFLSWFGLIGLKLLCWCTIYPAIWLASRWEVGNSINELWVWWKVIFFPYHIDFKSVSVSHLLFLVMKMLCIPKSLFPGVLQLKEFLICFKTCYRYEKKFSCMEKMLLTLKISFERLIKKCPEIKDILRFREQRGEAHRPEKER